MLFYCLLVLILIVFWRNFGTKNRKKPPGPFQWPIVGNILEMHLADPKFPHLALAKLAKRYGNIMSIKLGVHNVVVLSAFEDMKEILGLENFSGRYPFAFSRDRSFNNEVVAGLIWSSGQMWRSMNNFSLRHLRDFGFGKSSPMEAVITEELDDFASRMKLEVFANNGKYHVADNFSLSLVNILWSFIVGARYSLDTSKLQALLDANEQVVQTIKFNNVIVAYPALRHLFPEINGFKVQMNAFATQQNLFRELISNHKGSLDSEPHNFVGRFLENIKKDAENPFSTFTEDNLILLLMDFFLAGTETPISMLTYAVFFMMLNPLPQKRVQEEIRKIIPNGAHPTMADLERMPYTQATIVEIYRAANVLPIPPPRTTNVDFQYKNYVIPKGTAVMFNLYCVAMDQDYWGDPEIFRPERFLSKDGKEFENNERVAIFGFGKRNCIGESLARTTVSLFFLTLLQKFTFEQVPGQPLPSTIPRENFTMTPQPFHVYVKIN